MSSPAFLEEFERLEVELKSLFEQYIVRVRCLDALRAQVASRVKLPNQLQFPLAQASDTSMPFLPDGLIDSDEEVIVDDDDELRIPTMNPSERRRAAAAGGRSMDEATAMAEAGLMIRDSRRAATANRLRVRTAANRGGGEGGDRRFVGNMMGGSDLDSSLGSDDDDDDSDEDSDPDLGGELFQSDDDDGLLRTGAGETTNRTRTVLSDEDF